MYLIVFKNPCPNTRITNKPGANNITFILTETAKLINKKMSKFTKKYLKS